MSEHAAGSPSRIELMRRQIPGTEELEAVMFLLSLPPGAAAPAHRHPGIGVGYVLEGVYESQYEGEALRRFGAGEAIYDLAGTPHLIARNGSRSDPLRFVMTFIVRKGEGTVLPLE
jgi:quercetin dioxygenase-like cupin family protein